VQNHYNEPRLYRIMGQDGKFVQMMINQAKQHPVTGVVQIVNDVTVGKYKVTIDDAPISDTFLNAQFNEMLMILQKMGPAIGSQLPMFADLIIDASSMPRKDEWIERLKAAAQAGQQEKQKAELQKDAWFEAELSRVQMGQPAVGGHFPQPPEPPDPNGAQHASAAPHGGHGHAGHPHGAHPHAAHHQADHDPYAGTPADQRVVPFTHAPQRGGG